MFLGFFVIDIIISTPYTYNVHKSRARAPIPTHLELDGQSLLLLRKIDTGMTIAYEAASLRNPSATSTPSRFGMLAPQRSTSLSKAAAVTRWLALHAPVSGCRQVRQGHRATCWTRVPTAARESERTSRHRRWSALRKVSLQSFKIERTSDRIAFNAHGQCSAPTLPGKATDDLGCLPSGRGGWAPSWSSPAKRATGTPASSCAATFLERAIGAILIIKGKLSLDSNISHLWIDGRSDTHLT
jgi:hypothetical protein